MSVVALRRGSYFFLSYAPSGRTPQGGSDPLISSFFDDLCKAISDQVDEEEREQIGVFDARIPRGRDLKSEASTALRSTQVLVPLYSPRYFTSGWSMREHEAFERRLALLHAASPERHLVPVIWTPFLDPAERAERALRAGPADQRYQENGLRALHALPLPSYRSSYRRVVGWLADRIVAVTREQPIRPSTAPELGDVDPGTGSGPRFVVSLLSDPRARGSGGAGANRRFRWWHDVPVDADGSVVEDACTWVERMGLTAVVVPPAALQEETRGAPAVLLVDPWVVEDSGEQFLRDLAGSLPPWVSPVLLIPSDGSGSTPELPVVTASERVLTAARQARTPRVGSRAELTSVLPPLIARMRRQYLRHGPVTPPTGPSRPRPPRLGDRRIHREKGDHHG
ncbi:MAG TPA: TIR-like protein FxsC [Kineosporiaceae bacterium]